MAGPALAAAAWPVSTKMPVPMIAPTPSMISCQGPSTRCSPPARAKLLFFDLFDALGRQRWTCASVSSQRRRSLEQPVKPTQEIFKLFLTRDNIAAILMLAAEVETRRPRPGSVTFGPFIYDRGNRLLYHGDRELALPPRSACGPGSARLQSG